MFGSQMNQQVKDEISGSSTDTPLVLLWFIT